MAENITIARPYAEALFDLAHSGGSLNDWAARMGIMAQVAAHPDMVDAIANPNLPASQLYAVFAGACGENLTAEAQNLVRLLIENRRLSLLPEIRSIFEDLKRDSEGQVEAQITSAFPMEESQVQALVGDLEVRFKRRVRPQVNVDPELLGGVRISVGDEVIDGTVRGKLSAMATALKI